MLNNDSSNIDGNYKIDKNSKTKQRIAIYAPIELNDKLIKLSNEKDISRNKLALEILITFVNQSLEV